jgi:hypothetical protein
MEMAAMPLQNKVDPFGAIHAESMRGMFMGNRGGRIHDPATKTLLPGKMHASRQWITCLTAFKERPSRTVMGPGSYTELFFLDEVVSLSAGHRPCAECRRADFQRYCAAVSPDGKSMKAPDLDRQLHAERTVGTVVLTKAGATRLPDGAMIASGNTAFARRGNFALPFGFDGYGEQRPWEDLATTGAILLTPPASINALHNGYIPVWHPSATP